MSRRGQWFSLMAFILIVAFIVLVKYLAPYGETYLPEWIEKGNTLLQSIENHKIKYQHYPSELPVMSKCDHIPGCRKINYIKHTDRNGKEYFRIIISIHLREVLIYDSRKNLSQSDSWGNYKISNDWMWTKD